MDQEQPTLTTLARLERENLRLRGVLLEHGYGIAGVDPDEPKPDCWIAARIRAGDLEPLRCVREAAQAPRGLSAAARWAIAAVEYLEERVADLERQLAAQATKLSQAEEHSDFTRKVLDGELKRSQDRCNALLQQCELWRTVAEARGYLLTPESQRQRKRRAEAEAIVASALEHLERTDATTRGAGRP